LTFAQATTPASLAATSDELFQTISRLDNQVFEAIARCGMKTEASFWADDAEFYHDKNGLMVGGPASVYHQDMDPNNSVVRLCVRGTECEGRGRFEDAAQLFLSAWNESTDDFERCIAAHYVARHQKNPVDALMWNQRSLGLANPVAE
jgi:hypothetical protein